MYSLTPCQHVRSMYFCIVPSLVCWLLQCLQTFGVRRGPDVPLGTTPSSFMSVVFWFLRWWQLFHYHPSHPNAFLLTCVNETTDSGSCRRKPGDCSGWTSVRYAAFSGWRCYTTRAWDWFATTCDVFLCNKLNSRNCWYTVYYRNLLYI